MSSDVEALSQITSSGCKDAVGVEYICSPTVTHRSLSNITCVICSKSVLLSYLQHQFKHTGELSQKHTYSLEWLQAFIAQCSLRYTCPVCQLKSHDTISFKDSIGISDNGKFKVLLKVKQSIAELNIQVTETQHQISVVNQHIDSLRSELLSKLDSVPQPTPSCIAEYESNISKKSYAEVMTDIIKVVQSAVSEGFKLKSNDNKVDVSIIIFGLQESKNDIN